MSQPIRVYLLDDHELVTVLSNPFEDQPGFAKRVRTLIDTFSTTGGQQDIDHVGIGTGRSQHFKVQSHLIQRIAAHRQARAASDNCTSRATSNSTPK